VNLQVAKRISTRLRQTSAAECLPRRNHCSPENHEPFFNTIGRSRRIDDSLGMSASPPTPEVLPHVAN
jgi:hypothetical protein